MASLRGLAAGSNESNSITQSNIINKQWGGQWRNYSFTGSEELSGVLWSMYFMITLLLSVVSLSSQIGVWKNRPDIFPQLKMAWMLRTWEWHSLVIALGTVLHTQKYKLLKVLEYVLFSFSIWKYDLQNIETQWIIFNILLSYARYCMILSDCSI